jgi:hypothetical protein
VGVSSVTGDGVKEFFEAIDASREEYERYVSAGFATRDVSTENSLGNIFLNLSERGSKENKPCRK